MAIRPYLMGESELVYTAQAWLPKHCECGGTLEVEVQNWRLWRRCPECRGVESWSKLALMTADPSLKAPTSP